MNTGFRNTVKLLLVVSSITIQLNAQAVSWAKKIGGELSDVGNKIAVDINGNAYTAITFDSPTLTIGNQTFTNNGNEDVCITKCNSGGEVVWAKCFGGQSSDEVYSIAVDASGNVFVTGAFYSSIMSIGSIVLNNHGGYDIFLIKFDNNGNLMWAKNIGAANDDQGFAVTVDKNGNSFITGWFDSPQLTIGTTNLVNVRYYDLFLAKFDANGDNIWAKSVGGQLNELGSALLVDKNENIFLTGRSYSSTLTFGTTTLIGNGEEDFIIAKYSKDGDVIWAKNAGGIYSDYSQSIALDSLGSVYVLGYFFSPGFQFDGQLFPNHSDLNHSDIMLLKLDTNGNKLWGQSFGGYDDDYAHSLGTDKFGNVYMTGSFDLKPINFGSFTLANTGEDDLFVVKLNKDGVVIWATSAFGSKSDVGLSLGLNSNDQIFVTGKTASPKLEFGTTKLENILPFDVFVAKYNNEALEITSPRSREACLGNSEKRILWNMSQAPEVNLYFSSNNGTNWEVIANSVANNGVYMWTIPSLVSTDCKIKIEDASNNQLFKVSNQFIIWNPIVSNHILPIGQVNQNYEETNLTISGNVTVSDSTKVIYYPYERPYFYGMLLEIKAYSEYYWKLESDNLRLNSGKIRVPISTLRGVSNPSKLVWLFNEEGTGHWKNIGGVVENGMLVNTTLFDNSGIFAIGSLGSNLLDASDNEKILPNDFNLFQNFPNPFNPTTKIDYSIPYLTQVNLEIYNSNGQLVKTLVNELQEPGKYSVLFRADGISSGVYFYVLKTGYNVLTRKMIYLK